MPAVASASHKTFARYTLGGATHAVGTVDEYRGGVQYVAALEDDASLAERWIDDVARGGSVSLRIVDRPDLIEPLLTEDFTELLTEAGDVLQTEFAPFAALWLYDVDGLAVTVEVVTSVTYDDGTSAEFTRTQVLTTTARDRGPGTVTLTLTDVDDKQLNQPYPARTYQTSDWPLLLTSDAGRAVPTPRGIALKLPAVLVSNTAPWRYVVAAGTVTVLTVYRGKSAEIGRVVPLSEYTTGTSSTPYDHTYVEFATEQRDFDGSLYAISTDVQTTADGINAATEIETLLEAAGVTVDAASFATAVTFATDHALLVDLDHGRDGQRMIRAIIEDLLWILRASLTRTSAGAYGLVLDGSGSSAASYDEDAGDDLEVLGVGDTSRPLSVAISYRPSPRDPRELQHTLTRTVTGGVVVAERPRECRYVRQHATADRCIAYRAARAALPSRLRARIYRTTHAVGDVITVSSAAFALTGSTWRVFDVQHIVGGVQIEARPYDATLTSYTAGTLPADAVDDYQADYSQTAPDAPTSLRITAGDSNALYGAYVAVDALPPSANWSQLWFVLEHQTTGELVIQPGEDVGGGRYGLTVTGLRSGEVYGLSCHAVNAFGLRGASIATFDASGIGGGASDATFTTPGVANGAPAAPTSLRITGGGADASLRAYATVDAIPPTDNLGELWFVAKHNTTSDEIIGRGTDVGGGRYGVTLGTLRIGEVYTLRAYAVSPLAQQGGSVTTFDATAIGGGATDTTFTASGTAVGAPAAPTSMRVTATATTRGADGTIRARASVDCIAPTSNSAGVYIVATSLLAEESLLVAEDVGSGRVGGTFQNLAPASTYSLRAYARNNLNVAGPAATTFDATAIGGGAAVTNFNTATHSTAASTVASITATQGMGRLVNVSWPAVSDADLADYELERNVGGGTFFVVWRGQARSYIDRDIAYGNTYAYRVRARNTSGVYSAAYATSSGISPTTGGVTGGISDNDIGTGTVATGNRTAVSTVSGGFLNVTLVGASQSIGHSLGVVPICSANTGGKSNAWANVNAADSSAINVTVYGAPNAASPSSENAANPHQHVFVYAAGAGTVSIDIW